MKTKTDKMETSVIVKTINSTTIMNGVYSYKNIGMKATIEMKTMNLLV